MTWQKSNKVHQENPWYKFSHLIKSSLSDKVIIKKLERESAKRASLYKRTMLARFQIENYTSINKYCFIKFSILWVIMW